MVRETVNGLEVGKLYFVMKKAEIKDSNKSLEEACPEYGYTIKFINHSKLTCLYIDSACCWVHGYVHTNGNHGKDRKSKKAYKEIEALNEFIKYKGEVNSKGFLTYRVRLSYKDYTPWQIVNAVFDNSTDAPKELGREIYYKWVDLHKKFNKN